MKIVQLVVSPSIADYREEVLIALADDGSMWCAGTGRGFSCLEWIKMATPAVTDQTEPGCSTPMKPTE